MPLVINNVDFSGANQLQLEDHYFVRMLKIICFHNLFLSLSLSGMKNISKYNYKRKRKTINKYKSPNDSIFIKLTNVIINQVVD